MLLTLAAFTFAPAALAGEAVTEAHVDLDGDGKPEHVTIQKGTDGAYTLKAGTISGTGRVPGTEISGFTVEDVDASDKRREVLVHAIGELDDDHRVVFHGFDGKRWVELGTVVTVSELKGNGIVLQDVWRGFWPKRDKYALDLKATKLRHVPQELYNVGVTGKAGQTFPLVYARGSKDVVANVAPGSEIVVLACAPDAKNADNDWYLIKTASGLLGWAQTKTLLNRVDLPWAG